MEKRFLYGLVIVLIYLVDSGYSQGEVVKSEEEAEWERFVSESQLPILLTLTSPSCGLPCAFLEEQVASLAKLAYGDHIIFSKADILEKPFFARLYKVLSVPTLIAFKGGKEIKRLEKGFYWGVVYDQFFKNNFLSLYSALAPSPALAPTPAPAPAPLDSALLCSPLLEALDNAGTALDWEYAVRQSKLPIVLTIVSSLCGVPCVVLEDQVARLAKTYGKQIIFVTADILEKPFFAQLYKVVNVPTIVFLEYGTVEEYGTLEKFIDGSDIYEKVQFPV